MKYFTPKSFLTGVFIFGMVSISFIALTNGSGGPAGNSHAPYNSRTNCTQCHSGTIQTSGTNWSNISFEGDFNGTGGYTPDSTYNMMVKYVHTGKSTFGFQVIPMYSSGDSMAGSVANNSGGTRKVTQTWSGQTMEFITHSSSGNSGTDSIEWTFDWTAPSRNVGPVTFFVVVNSANGNGGNSGDIIIAREFTVGLSNLFPVSTITADTNVICNGDSLQFYGDATQNANLFSWRFPGGSPSTSSDQNPKIRFNGQGTQKAYLKSGTSGLGYGAEDTFEFTVRPPITAFIGGGNKSICEGDSVQITANFVVGQDYVWMNGETGNQIWAKDTGDYYVTVSRNGCDRTSNTVRVNFKSKPSASLSSDVSIYGDTACVNSTITLQTSSGFDSFYYYRNGKLLAVTDSENYSTNFDMASTYGLRVRSATNGCLSDLATYDIAQRDRLPAPSMTCDSSSSSAVTFSWTVPYATSGFEISIDSGNNWIDPSSGSMGMNHLITGMQPETNAQLWLRAYDDLPCGSSEIAKQVCKSDTCNSLSFTIDVAERACLGENVPLTINGLKDAKYAVYFELGGPSTDTIYNFIASTSRNYNVSVIDSNFLVCPAEVVTFGIKVDTIQSTALSFDNGASNYCPGDEVTVSAPEGMENYAFWLNTAEVQNSSVSTYVSSDLNNGDSIQVVLTKGACTDTSDLTAVPMDPAPNASFTFQRFGPNYVFTPEDNGLLEYSWEFGNGTSSDEEEPTVDLGGEQNTDVKAKLTVTSANGCTNSDSVTISVPDMTSISELKTLGLEIYPNPVENELRIKSESGKPFTVKVVDVQGKLIYENSVQGISTVISAQDWNAGVYLIEIEIDGKTISHRVIKN
ncbi:T9SS type A sorting domain-containing protein [bacterium]|nr:T9SS type A sorting domain-containing protein [bacterium]